MTSRVVGAAALGLGAGAGALVVLLLAGWLLYQRLWGDSVLALTAIAVLFGIAGLYAGWLLGMLVFSAVRGEGRDADGG
ncbi:MAG TPA: hypothetical protein VFA92_16470 [Candidatus Binatia bacterium]|nr:hypothetical protein [Candidatus Binatia bacterium]